MPRALVVALAFAVAFAILVGAPAGHMGLGFVSGLVVGLLGYGILKALDLSPHFRWEVMRRSRLLGFLLLLLTRRR